MTDILTRARAYLTTQRDACAYVEDCIGTEAREIIEGLMGECERLGKLESVLASLVNLQDSVMLYEWYRETDSPLVYDRCCAVALDIDPPEDIIYGGKTILAALENADAGIEWGGDDADDADD